MTRKPIARALGALAMLSVGVFAACGDDDDSSSDETSETTDATAAPDDAAPDDEAAAGDLDLSDPDVAAVAEAWTTVFDSTVAADAKSAFLEDPAGVADTLTAYAATGEAMQGITLEPTDVTIDGDTATVTYDIFFAGTATYEAQTGTVVNQGGEWKVTTEQFCSFMATARTACA